MTPFYFLATAIVVAGGILSFRQASNGVPLDVKSQTSAALPPRPMTEAGGSVTQHPFKGEAPWAFAALPDCFEQTKRVDGPKAFVHARLPHDVRPLPPGASLQAHDCRLNDERGNVVVVRGHDRFDVTGGVEIYRRGAEIVTYRERGQLAELRTYRILK